MNAGYRVESAREANRENSEERGWKSAWTGAVVGCAAREAMARNRANTCVPSKKIPTNKSWDFNIGGGAAPPVKPSELGSFLRKREFRHTYSA